MNPQLLSRITDKTRSSISHENIGYLLFLPALVLIGLLIIAPIIFNLFISFTDRHLLSAEFSLVYFDNYVSVLAQDVFWDALFNNIIYAISTTAISVIFGLSISLILNNDFKGRGLVTTIAIYPYLAPSVVVAVAFLLMLNSTFGSLNAVLIQANIISTPVRFLTEWPMISVVFASVWRFTPFVIILCLARLQTIPDNLYEAAMIEGANKWQQFRYVTLPQMKLVLFIAILLRFIWVFNMFDIIWLITGGGPQGATKHLPIMIYQTMFNVYNVGLAATISVLTVAVLIISVYAYFQITGGFEDDE